MGRLSVLLRDESTSGHAAFDNVRTVMLTEFSMELTEALRSAWVGSIQYALVFIPGVFTGRLVDLGYFRVPFSVGTAFVIIATFLTAQCTKYWHFLLCQGIFLGVRLVVLSISYLEC